MPKIVMVRGTSGSGKTHIAMRLLEALGSHERIYHGGPRKGIAGYQWDGRKVFVAGRYETACGGCDGLSWKGAADDLEGWLTEHVRDGYSCFLEGLMVSTWGADRLLRLDTAAREYAAPEGGLTIVHLTTPLKVCLESVQVRRDTRARQLGKEIQPLNPKNTTEKYNGLLTHTRNQRKRGLHIEEHSRETAAARVLELLVP